MEIVLFRTVIRQKRHPGIGTHLYQCYGGVGSSLTQCMLHTFLAPKLKGKRLEFPHSEDGSLIRITNHTLENRNYATQNQVPECGIYAVDHMEKPELSNTRVNRAIRLQIAAYNVSIFHSNTEIVTLRYHFNHQVTYLRIIAASVASDWTIMF